MTWLDEKVALVTGAGSGIGRAVTQRYLAEGARVVALDIDRDALRGMEGRDPDRLACIRGDVRDAATHQAAVACAIERFGGLDILVGNAGIFDYFARLDRYAADTLGAAFDELFGVNVKGYLFAAHAAADALRERQGTMIFTASVAALNAGGGGVLYTAAKHAVVGLVRQLAQELAPHVRVNAVAPGGTLTALRGTQALGHGSRHLADTPGLETSIRDASPLGFVQTPEHHAGLYVLLASRENSAAVTGQVLVSDGGIGVRPIR